MSDKRQLTCIACPVGCRLDVWLDEQGSAQVENHGCKRGVTYGRQEFTNPMRTVTSSVRVSGGARPLCAVKTRAVVPKAMIPQVLSAIQKALPSAPIEIGQTVIANIAGTGVDLVATADVGLERNAR